MKFLIAIMLVSLGLLSGPAVPYAATAPTHAACLVCAVTKGEAEEEPVKAVRTHEGKEYGFCSVQCAKTFDADPAAYLPPEFPRAAPAFTLTDLSGKSISNESLKGRVVLLDFWATWCVPCRKSMPELQALHAKYASQGLSVIGVSIDEGAPAKVKKFVVSKKFSYPIAIDSAKEPAWDAFRVKAVPAAYLIDREGRIVAQWLGAAASSKELEAKLGELLRAD